MICRYFIHLIFFTTLLLITDFVVDGKKSNDSSTPFKRPVLTQREKEIVIKELHRLNTEYEKLVAKGNYKEAVPIQTTLSQLTEELAGPDDPATMTMYIELSELHLKLRPQGISEAIAYLWKVYKSRERVLGEFHRDTINILAKLGNLYLQKGKHLKALGFLKKAYKRHRDLLGPEHMDTIQTLFVLAKAVEREHGRTAQDLEKAQNYFKKVLEVQTRELGEEDPLTLATTLQIGLTAIHQKNLQLLLDCSKKVYETRAKLLGEDDPSTSEAKQFYAMALTGLGREKEARVIHRMTRESHANDFDSDSSPSDSDREAELINLVSGHSLIHMQKGDHVKGLETALNAYAIVGKDHPRAVQILSAIVELQRSLKNYQETIHYVKEFLESILKNFPSDDDMIFDATENLARAYWEAAEMENFKKTFDKLVTLSRKTFKDGDENVKMLSVLIMAAEVKTEEKNWDEGFRLHAKTYRVAEKVPEKGEAAVEVRVASLQAMGEISSAQEKWSQAAEFYEKAYKMLKSTYGVKHERLKGNLKDWANYGRKAMEAQLESGQYDEALGGISKLQDILKEVQEVKGNSQEFEEISRVLTSALQELKEDDENTFEREEL